MFKQPEQQPDFSKLDEAVTAWWKENQIFEKSVEMRDGAEGYVFYDGPPFMSGIPHYATLLSSLPKDAIPRYQTMQGKRVERLWGWDTHGLPIENKVEDQLKLSGRRAILDFGLDKFIEKCYEWNRVGIENWRWYIDKIGRWADMDNAYRTLDQEYMESIWWGFAQMWEKGLVYKGLRTSMFSTDSSTPVSDFEVSMDPDNYRDTVDLAIAVKFKLTESSQQKLGVTKPTYFVAWTTTPWTIPSNFALAVNPEAEYVLLENAADAIVVAKERLEYVQERLGKDSAYAPGASRTGSELAGLKYEQIYNFLAGGENDFTIYESEGVTTEDGTGVLHIAPAFGAEDFELGKQFGLSNLSGIDDQGNMTVGPWAGTYLREANPVIAADLKTSGHLLFEEQYTHRLPYYRYSNPLIYKTIENYFVDVQKLKTQLIQTNDEINWVPEHFKKGRFEYILETAPDWSISRTRFWGTAMPLWESTSGKQVVIASRDQLMQLVNASGKPETIQKVVLMLDEANADLTQATAALQAFIGTNAEQLVIKAAQPVLTKIREHFLGETAAESSVKLIVTGEERAYYLFAGKPLDLHRPFIDQVKFSIDGEEYSRVEYTLDVWMDSGSMPFAQFHYPYQNKEKFEANFPGDFIAEYTGQIRAWFYVLHVLSNAIFDKPSFKNVLVTGVLAGNDGRKMSKSFGNYPDPEATLQKYGGEALRLYFLGSTVMNGNDIDFSEEELQLQIREFLLPLWNIYKYFVTYANMHEWVPKPEFAYNLRNVTADEHPWDHIPFDSPGNELDGWMLTVLQKSIAEVTGAMDRYDLPKAVRELKLLLDEISKWYIRRSRDRFAAGEDMALSVLYYTLVEFCKLAAPIAPFTTEEIYRNLVADHFHEYPESVHLSDYPVVDVKFFDENKALLPEMEMVRAIADLGQVSRAAAGMKVRQPLSKLYVQFSAEALQSGAAVAPWMAELLADELNVLEVDEVPALPESDSLNVQENTKFGIKIALETALTPELAEQGLVREIIRQVQNFRKKQGLSIGQEINLGYSTDDANLALVMQKHAEKIREGVSASGMVEDAGATEEVKVNDLILKISIAR